jgi:ketol-acid reductoisomerase
MKPYLKSIQEQLDQIKEAKYAKRSDLTLARDEKLATWRNSEQNKNRFREVGCYHQKITQEQIREIRDKFYKQNVTVVDLLGQYDIKGANLRKLLQNTSHQISNWDYPDYEKQKQYNIDLKNQVRQKIEYIKEGYGVTNFCEKFNCTFIVYYNLVKKYNLQTPPKAGRKRPKNFV